VDIQLVGLIALIIIVIIAATRQHRRVWRGRPSWLYQRVFSVGFAGLLFVVSGVMGWDLSHSHGWFRGARWVDAPVWWQIGLGSVLLLLAIVWARRVPTHQAH
jgi:hypothetical protein